MSFGGILQRKGAAVTFTRVTPGTYNRSTDRSAPPTTVTVTGFAMQIDGDPDLYVALGLIESENPTLLFRPTTPGVLPALGATVTWGGEPFTVKNIKSLAMAGTPTAARIVVSR
jgi:hypothetical protein